MTELSLPNRVPTGLYLRHQTRPMQRTADEAGRTLARALPGKLIGGCGTNLRGAGGLTANARSTMRNDRGQNAARAAGDGEQVVPRVQTIRCSPAATETIALGRKNEP